jgi:hypothetical protein
MQELERQFHCKIVIETALVPKGKGVLSVDVVAKRVRGRNDWYTVVYEVARWPTHGHKTMPSLLLRRLWELSNALHDYDDLPLLRSAMPEASLPRPPAEA